jgi:hypothetical protein
VEYQQIGAWWHGPVVSTDILSLRGGVSWNAAGTDRRVVFGTLLGPEATGPVGWAAAYGLWCVLSGLFVSGFLAAPITRFPAFVAGCVWGVWFGVVV